MTRPLLPLVRLPPHAPAEGCELGEVPVISNGFRDHVAVDDYGLVEHKGPAALIIAPHASRLGIRGSSPEDFAEHGEGFIDPVILVDLGLAIPFDAGDEQNHEDALAA